LTSRLAPGCENTRGGEMKPIEKTIEKLDNMTEKQKVAVDRVFFVIAIILIFLAVNCMVIYELVTSP
jgi:hypothetical protein